MIFDTHAHYDDEAFNDDREDIISSLSDYMIINPGCDVLSSKKAMKIAEDHDNFYFAAGLHPEEIDKADENYLSEIEILLKADKCVAAGEIGLDYYWDDSKKELQKEIFSKQIELAIELCKPVIIHDREAHGDCLEIIRRYDNLKGVFHCYSGSAEMAEELLKRGFYLGFDGPVTYKNARKTIEVLDICPLDRILIETDSPYLSPVPMRGKRNDSRNLEYIIAKIAEIKGEKNIEEITFNNAKKLFFD